MRNLLIVLGLISLLVLSGCSGGGGNSSVARLEISAVSNNNSAGLAQSSVKGISTQPFDEMIYSTEIVQRGNYYLLVRAYDDNNRSVDINGNDVNWICNTAGINIGSNTGLQVEVTSMPNPGKYSVSATYQNISVSTSIYVYQAKAMEIMNDYGVQCGMNFSTNIGTNNTDIADIYISNLWQYNFDIHAPCGIAFVDTASKISEATIDVSSLTFNQTTLTVDTANFVIDRIYIIKCRDGGYAKFKFDGFAMYSDNIAVAIYYRYSSSGNLND